MITAKDIIECPTQKQWFKDGIDYALISWCSTFNRMGKPNPYKRVEKIILGIIAERALEEYLCGNRINYETQGKTKWYETDRYDIGINGYAIDVKSNFLDLNSTYIGNKLNNLFEDKNKWFLKCHGLVPLDQFNPGKNERRAHKRDKVYMFPFIEGYFAHSTVKAPLIHTFWDYRWLKRAECKDLPHLGYLTIQYDGELNKSSIKIYGTTDKNVACIEEVKLTGNDLTTKNNFFQAFSIEWKGQAPTGKLIIRSKRNNLKEKIYPDTKFILEETENGYWPSDNNWQSLAIYDCNIYLLGWIYEEDFRVIGKEYPRFTKTIEQYPELKVDNWGCLIKDLQPMNKIHTI